MAIFIQEQKRGVRSLVIWSLSVGALLLFCLALFPSMKSESDQISAVFAQMGGFSAAFGMDSLSFGTAMGFYGIECGACLALGGGLFAAFAGSGMLSKEELGHTAEFLYTHPISRARILSEKLAALALQILLFNLICMAFSLVGFGIVGESPDWTPFLLFHLAQFLMQLQLAVFCFAVSAFAGRSSLGCGIGIMAVLYFLSLWGNLSDDIRWVRFITPFWYADSSRVIVDAQINIPLVLLGFGYAAAAFGLAVWYYRRKDLTA